MLHNNALPTDISDHRGFGHHLRAYPAESDGYTMPSSCRVSSTDYRWPMVIAGHDSSGIQTPVTLGTNRDIEEKEI